MSFVRAAATEIGRTLTGPLRHVIVNKATVPIGCCNLVELWLQDGYAEEMGNPVPESQYAVASNPEFLREGSAIHDTLHPDRIVLGSDDAWAFDQLKTLYEPLIQQTFPECLPDSIETHGPDPVPVPVIETDRVTAEMIKYAANAFLATKISFANEVANISELVGADMSQVAQGMGLDQRIGPRFLSAGIGWGGSCFRKDVSELTVTAEQYGYVPRILHAAMAVNYDQRKRIIKHLQEELKTLKGRRIALWGLSFKPGTDDLRDAPSLTISEELTMLGARITVYDPVAMQPLQRQRPDLHVTYAVSPQEALPGCDALVLCTEWPEFRDVPTSVIAELLHYPLVIDGRGFWDPDACHEAGLRYRGIGRGS